MAVSTQFSATSRTTSARADGDDDKIGAANAEGELSDHIAAQARHQVDSEDKTKP